MSDELLERYYPKIAAVSNEMAALVFNRSGGVCEICKKRPAEVIHHICGRGVRAWYGNLLHLCTSCHIDSKKGIHSNTRLKWRYGLWLQMLYFKMGFTRSEVVHLMGMKSMGLYYVRSEEEWKNLGY